MFFPYSFLCSFSFFQINLVYFLLFLLLCFRNLLFCKALTEQRYNCKVITFRSATNITVTAPAEMNWTLDGEMEPGHETIRVENLHHAIRLMQRRTGA